MYLNTVLNDINKELPKSMHSELLYKLNEAIFNLPEEDFVDAKMGTKLYQAISKIRESYMKGQMGQADNNFFYDYLALLGTMQNQHFFNSKQSENMLAWIRECLGADGGQAQAAAPPPPAPVKHQENKADLKKLEKLEGENEQLRAEMERFAELQSAVHFIQHHKPKGAGKGRAKGDGRGRADSEDSKGSGKGGRKGRGDSEDSTGGMKAMKASKAIWQL